MELMVEPTLEIEQLKALSAQIKALTEPTIQVNVNGPFSTEQKVGVEFLYRMKRALLADEIGLGKSAVTVGLLNYLAEQGEGKRFLVLCSASILLQWAQEIAKYAPKLQVVVLRSSRAGNKMTRMAKYNAIKGMGEHPVVVVCSYDIFCTDLDLMYKIPWDAVAVDESSAVKNSTTRRFKAVRVIAKMVERLVLLSATPLENDVMDLYSNVELLYPGYLGDEEYFKDRYVIQYEIPLKVNAHYYRTIKKISGYKKLDELRSLTEWIILRRKPEECGVKYPDLKVNRIFLDMMPQQRKIYADLRDGILKSARTVRKVKLIARFKYLFMCADGSLAQYLGLSSKIQAAMNLIDAFLASGRKVVLFSHSKRVVNYLEPLICNKGLNVLRITGDEDDSTRNRAMMLFNNDPDYKVLLMTTAGSRGVNLIGACDMIMYNSTFNYQLNRQIWGRLMRRTQESDVVNVYELYTKRSIEKSLLDIIERKKDLFNQVIEGQSKVVRATKQIGVSEMLLALRTDNSEGVQDG